MTATDTSFDSDAPVYTAMDFGSKEGDFTAIAQFQPNADGSYTIKGIKYYRAPSVRSKARVKRIIKNQSKVMDQFPMRLGRRKDGKEIYPVNWREIVTHKIRTLL